MLKMLVFIGININDVKLSRKYLSHSNNNLIGTTKLVK